MRIIYLHGLASSPDSAKGRILSAWAKDRHEFEAPDLNFAPSRVREILDGIVARVDPARALFVGSSLGGFYATYAAELSGARAVLLNPACAPWEVVEERLGEIFEGPDGPVAVEASFADGLRAMALPPTRPGRYFVILSTGDEVLDWRQAARKYRGFSMHVIEGGDHVLTGFERLLPLIETFLAV